MLDAWFAQTGLGGLADQAWQKILQGDSPAQVIQWTRTTPQYAARYPAMAELNKTGRGISEAAYQSYEQTIYQLVQQAGLPKGMYDTPDQIAKMLLNNVSPNEAQTRYQDAVAASYTAPESVRTAMGSLYGVNSGGIVGMYLDATKAMPELQRQFAASQVAGGALDQGITIGRQTAEQLAAQGVTYAQALSGFGNVAATQALARGQGEVANQDVRTAAQFGDALAQAKVTRVVKGRLASFGAAGSPTASQAGVSGLGTTTS
jgi:hypothetical protein